MVASMKLCKMAVMATVVSVRAFESDIISDLTTTATDEKRALKMKSDDFWQPVLDNAESSKMASAYTHLSIYEEVEAALKALPSENAHVKGLLEDALLRLKRADAKVFQQAVDSAEVAAQQLLDGPTQRDAFSFLTGGQNYFTQAIRRFVGFGKYSESVGQQVRQRRTDVTPLLRGAADKTSNLLTDCREASNLSFDVLKYDIYNQGVPKTPEDAKAAAHKLAGAIAETRHNFMAGITNVAKGISRDGEEKDMAASATVTKTLTEALNLPPLKEGSPLILDI
eukprot:TRINITY_DN1542_c0_g1_i4.p1 TRINITY_DN1542_c0_g1~~TRINITY_DN1542_c0_g1_i4.p1  ORF type:complete len:282 (-),score=83.28 TRINITY_DN1542_c0_g1_i4:38-883(-)